MKFLTSITLAALSTPVAAQLFSVKQSGKKDIVRDLRGKKSKGKSKGSTEETCYTNEGYAWANEIITDGTCPYVPPSYALPVDPVPFITHCSASGGFNVMSFIPGSLVPVACCDLCALDVELLTEECTVVPVPDFPFTTDPAGVCPNSPYAQGLAVVAGDTINGFTFYCCGQVTP